MDELGTAWVRGLMDFFPAVDLPLERIGFTGALIAAVVAVGLVSAACIAVYTYRRASRRRVGPTVYLPRHPTRKPVNQRRWWSERWVEFVRDESRSPGDDHWGGR